MYNQKSYSGHHNMHAQRDVSPLKTNPTKSRLYSHE